MRIVALVPALNEADRVGAVLEVLVGAEELDEVVVIDDGSTDQTTAVARAAGATVVTHPENLGKGAALQRGIEEYPADAYVFIDADLIGLTRKHLSALLAPVLEEPAVMMVTGTFSEGRLRVDLAQRYFPILNGQRVLRREFIESMAPLGRFRWGVEVLMTLHARRSGARSADVLLEGLSQVMKEEKDGFAAGLYHRSRMYYQVLMTYVLARIGLISSERK